MMCRVQEVVVKYNIEMLKTSLEGSPFIWVNLDIDYIMIRDGEFYFIDDFGEGGREIIKGFLLRKQLENKTKKWFGWTICSQE